MTIHRKSKRRSHIRIRRYSQNPSASHTGSATSAAANVQLRDETTRSNPTEAVEGVQWAPRVVGMTPVESAISTAADRQNDRDDSEVEPRDSSDATRIAPNDVQWEAQRAIASTPCEQLLEPSAAEEQKNAVSEPGQDAATRSVQAITDEQNKNPGAERNDTKSKSAEATSPDAVDFLMQDFMNSQPPPPPPEEVT